MKLNTQPSGDVTVTINDPSNADATAEPASLTSTTTKWNDEQTVTVSAAEDDDAIDEAAVIISHTVSGGD